MDYEKLLQITRQSVMEQIKLLPQSLDHRPAINLINFRVTGCPEANGSNHWSLELELWPNTEVVPKPPHNLSWHIYSTKAVLPDLLEDTVRQVVQLVRQVRGDIDEDRAWARRMMGKRLRSIDLEPIVRRTAKGTRMTDAKGEFLPTFYIPVGTGGRVTAHKAGYLCLYFDEIQDPDHMKVRNWWVARWKIDGKNRPSWAEE